MASFWVALSQQVRFLGWVYTAAWSLSFYPQAITNYRRRSVTGVSIDFLLINPFGFLCYFLSNTILYASPVVRKQYQQRHDGHLPQVQPNDVAFAAHAFLLSTLTLLQTLIYKVRRSSPPTLFTPRRSNLPVQRDSSQRPSLYNLLFLSLAVSTIFAGAVLAGTSSHTIAWLDLVIFLSWLKLYISFAKYVPQVVLNYRRKSTEGWSIENIILDLTGGTLSLAQLVLDAWIDADWRAITGNPGKLGLSLLSLSFDLVFVAQHFVLYRDARSRLLKGGANSSDQEQARGALAEGERAPLLRGPREDEA
ncbi:SPOSA6832_01171 [Sporobolomyces salmonicolor]|uniref:SPOSA6832_01171-mRNA-1:cds n=1 Tax=Sporidiobolus salmonicolor TaxID=5005 RepID=A0A0D6EII6_SPOSA|nr:SPOSA6832_01171 [Sporobolomyces salmonicolor]